MIDLDTEAIEWPVVTRYSGRRLEQIAMPVGGIGTGCISLGGRGQLIDWELFNRPAKGFNPLSFFAVRTQDADGQSITRVLEGALTPRERDGHLGSAVSGAGLPRFSDAVFEAAYPFGRVRLSDPELPIAATVSAFNPLVPGDSDASGLPLFVFRVRLSNLSQRPVHADVCGNVQHIIGWRKSPYGEDRIPDGNRFEPFSGGGFDGLRGYSTTVDETDETWGTLAFAVLGDEVSTRRTTWARRSWGDSLLDFWDDFAADGQVTEPEQPGATVPTGSLVTSVDLEPGEAREVSFVIAWHTPNRYGWQHDWAGLPQGSHSTDWVGNHYAQRFTDAGAVVEYFAPRLAGLEAATAGYVRSVADSGLPVEVQDAVLSNVAVLKSPTCFRIAGGTFLAWEGCNPTTGSCHGSCTHVWNYQYALEQLFPDLAWSMRDVEFRWSLDDRGMMSFRAGLPLATQGNRWRVGAADGQMGALVRLHRTWLLSGDRDRLKALWPHARRAMEFAWIEHGWDADQDGLMEGCQHNTMDVEYYGPNGVDQSWYLAALVACADMATACGDIDFAARCTQLAAAGAKSTDELLYVAGYYEQDVRPAMSVDNIAEGLRIRYAGENPAVGSDDLEHPDLQIGSGCTTDQLVGHSMLALSGLGTGLDPQHVRQALRTVVAHNHRDGFTDQLNHLRTFATADERGLINCSFPRGQRPQRPFPYCYEVWTGLEYSAAVGLAIEGDVDAASTIAGEVRDRYNGERRNPFNEIECGNHYVRSMASFGLAHAWSGAVVRGDDLSVAPRTGRWPVIAGSRIGIVEITADGPGWKATYIPGLGSGFSSVEVRS
ncbi:GH116 family glycosyl-hydrolase [Branchiibius sp. NY16-3462-2]|uniref:GH116 family glycosyl-hydrolase n=1 Tax=Branchiibius sp. NY16-3462-2 TaxID=1807500 RepID=UPI000795ABB5|nr:GH116 family glycosyl-hydrolase [Branchiibius sp. NY16-3462-2]KYH43223.1 hypothetical protein AZH51_12775 [Branchiibius sp. NY16-3462-2]